MTAQAQMTTRHDLEAKIVQRSWEDEGFRGELLADPTGAFSRHFEIPTDKVPWIRVHEESAETWHIVLPAKTAGSDELSDADLEKVAGGTSPAIVSVVVSTASLGSIVVTVEQGGW
jgi:hypothetical protein